MLTTPQTIALDPTLGLIVSLWQRLRPEEKIAVKEFLNEKEKSKKEFKEMVGLLWQRTKKYGRPNRQELENIVDEVRKDIYAKYSAPRRH